MKKQKKQVAVKTIKKINIPTSVQLIDDNGTVLNHWIETPEDLEATIMIAHDQGMKVKYKNTLITL